MSLEESATGVVDVDDGGDLCCPGCGEGFMHHTCVNVFARDREDQPGNYITVEHTRDDENARITIERRDAGFSRILGYGRRGEVEITFWCECCHENFILSFQQHKGHTIVGWSEGPLCGCEHCVKERDRATGAGAQQ